MLKLHFAFVNLLMLPCISVVLYADDIALYSELQHCLDSGLDRDEAHGVSAAVIFPDDAIWTGVSGVSHDDVSITPDMLFAIGSITKNVVATLTLKLVEEGLFELEDPISKWLPSYQYIDNNITVRQLLNHTSGICQLWDNDQLWDDLKKDKSKRWAPEEILSYIREPYFIPGKGWHYSNTNYLLMAMILTKVTGSKLSKELRTRFWEPMKLDQTFLSIEEEIPDNQVHIYGDDFMYGDRDEDLTFQPRTSHDSIIYGSGGLFMTAECLVRWCHALFEGRIIKPESMKEMLTMVEIDPSF